MPIAPLIAAASALGSALASIPAWVGVVLNIGLSLISSLFQKKPDKPNDQQQVLRQEAPDRRIVLGRAPIGGYIILIETYNGKLYVLQYYCEGTADYTGADVYVDQRLTTFGKDGWSTSKPAKGYYYFDKRSGTVPGVPYQKLLEDLAPYVNKNFRGDGMNTGLFVGKSAPQEKASKVYPNGIASTRVVANWNACYDPRTKKTAFSKNLVLHTLYYLRSRYGCGYPDSFIDLAGTWARAATVADQALITRDGSSIRRYEGSTGWLVSERRADVLQRLVMPMDARLFMLPSGKIGIRVGEWEEPTVHIPDDVIIDAHVHEGPTEPERCKSVVIKWTNPAAQYTETTSRPWEVDAVSSYDEKQYPIPQIQSHNHARRIAKIIKDKLTPDYQGWVETTLYGMKAWTQRFITISFVDSGMDRHPVEVEKITLNRDKCTVRIQFRTARKERYAFNAATEEGAPIVVPQPIGEKDPVLPSNVKVTATVGASGTSLKMSCNKPVRPGDNSKDPATIYTEWAWGEANSDVWNTLGRGESTSAYVGGIQSKGPFDVKVRHIGANGYPSDDVIIEDIDPGESKAGVKPPAPTDVSVAVSKTAAKTAEITFTTPKDPTVFAAVEIWRGASADGAGAELVTPVYRSKAGRYTVTDEAGAGTWYYFAASVTWGGLSSGRVAASNNPIKL